MNKAMNYELAKELKDAGFPQDSEGLSVHPSWCSGWEQCNEGFTGRKCTKSDQVVDPILEELIDACGDKFRRLELQAVHIDKQVWYAGAGTWSDAFGYEFFGRGTTPKEAVARLWLALNKKP